VKKDSGVFSVFVSPRSFPLTIAIIFLLVFGAASVIAYQHHRSTLRHTINENKSTANLLSNLIYEHQKAAIGTLESYASRPGFVDAIQKKAFNQAIPRLKSLSEHHPEIDAIFITDQYGTVWANYPINRELYGKNFAERDWYKGVSRKWQHYVSILYQRVDLEKSIAVSLCVPVFDKKGKVVGILGNAQSTAFFNTLIKANRLDPKKSITLLDQEGNIIYSDTIEYEKEITKCPHFLLIQKAIRDGKNTLEVTEHLKKGREDILAFSPVRGIGWTVIVGEEKGAMLKSERGYFIGTFLIAFLLFVCMTMVPLLLQRELRHRKTKELLENERRLRESEDKFRVLAESTPTAIMMYQNNKWVYANPAAESISGYSLKELAAMDFWAFVHPDYRHIIRERGQKRQAGEATANRYEFKVVSKDGTEKWVDLSGASTMLGGSPAGIISVTDITSRKQAEELLSHERQRFSILSENAPFGMAMIDKEGNFVYINPKFKKISGYDLSDIPDGKTWFTKAYPDPAYRHTVISAWVEDLKGVGPGEKRPRVFTITSKDGTEKIINFIPVQMETGVHVMTCEDITSSKQAEESLQQTLEKLRKSLVGTIQVVSTIVETRDPYTAGHQRKVSSLARTIAQEMGLPNDTVDTTRMAGIIHDIGKISIPAEILSKPTKLTDTEFSLIKDHSKTAYDILKDVGLPYPIAEIVLQHHERLDGSGYPQGLKGDQILLEARIIAVADVVEAISSHRPYRPGFGIDVALEEIEKNAGVLYDRKAVEICLKLFREKGFSFE